MSSQAQHNTEIRAKRVLNAAFNQYVNNNAASLNRYERGLLHEYTVFLRGQFKKAIAEDGQLKDFGIDLPEEPTNG